MCAPCVSASDPRPPEVLNASYSVPSISISSSPSRGATSSRRPSLTAWQALPYSLMSPSVDQVSEYLRTLFTWSTEGLINEYLGGPGERVLEDVVRVLGQGADAQLHGPQRVKVRDQLGSRDADEPGSETTLRHECLASPRREGAYGARDVHIFCPVEVVGVRLAGGCGDPEVAVVRQARNDGIDRVLGEVPGKRHRIGRIEREGEDVARVVGAHHRLRRSPVDIAQLNLVTARFG